MGCCGRPGAGCTRCSLTFQNLPLHSQAVTTPAKCETDNCKPRGTESPIQRAPPSNSVSSPARGAQGPSTPPAGSGLRPGSSPWPSFLNKGSGCRDSHSVPSPGGWGPTSPRGRHGTHFHSRAPGLSRAGALTARGSGMRGEGGAALGAEHRGVTPAAWRRPRETKREENRPGPGSEMSQAPALVAF